MHRQASDKGAAAQRCAGISGILPPRLIGRSSKGRCTYSSSADLHRSNWILIMLALSVLAGTATVYVGLSPAPRALLYQAFAAVCHQIPERSPRITGVLLPVCHRCYGVYVGLFAAPWVALLWRGLRVMIGRHPRPALLLSLVPIGLDWLLGLLQVWENTAGTRTGTGVFFGLIAGHIAVVMLAWPNIEQLPLRTTMAYLSGCFRQSD